LDLIWWSHHQVYMDQEEQFRFQQL
jgi:hypothetical protein